MYNNYYIATDEETFQYAWGVGIDSAIYAENNFVLRSADVAPSDIVFDGGCDRRPGRRGRDDGDRLAHEGRVEPARAVNFLAEYNAAADPDIPPTP